MVITDQAQFEQLVQEVRDQILSESQGVGEVDIVDNLDNIYSLPALKLNDNGEQVVEAPLSLLSAPAEEAAATANAAAQAANTAAESANSAASSANSATDKTNAAISNAQSATQQAESSADKANTAAQNADEATAQVLSGESERVEAENARQAAETERQSAEEERKSAEEARKLAEQTREEAEASRVSAEESRVTAESERVTAESSRAQAETERVQKESERESAESTRQQNETSRQSNETTRVQQEQTRQTNEEQRVSAESSRETEYADLKQRSDALIDDNEAAIENANTAAENANAAIANMENTYAKKDEIPDVSEFITISVDNLVNYYRKSETYNQEQINSLIGSITTINFKIVDSLPGTGENNLIYLVPSSKQEENNVKDEYIWVDNSWELIGSTKIDLSNYYTRDEVNSTFALKTELAWDTITGKPVWIGSSKPTYTWSEINKKPTTISGYGITDAYTKTESDGRYVNISGDTMTGTLYFTGDFPQIITNEDLAGGIRLGKGIFGWNITAGTYISGTNTGEGHYANIKSDSLYWNNTSKFWHAGNDGSGSGLDADLLDGVHYQNILERDYSKIKTINTTGWYRIAETTTANNGGISFKLLLIREYNNSNNETYSFDITINHNSTQASIVQTSGYANDRLITKIRVTGNQNMKQYVDIYYNSSKVNNVRWTTIGCAESIDAESNAEALTYTTEFETTNGCKSSLGFVGALTGNADTATKLRTPRTIWGQSFDGTGNVDGVIRISGVVPIGTEVKLSTHPTFKLTNKSSEGYGLYGWITGNGYAHLQAGYEDNHGFFPICLNELGGNVGFGITSPQYKVDVAGDIRATGNIIGTVSSDIQLKTILNTIDYQDKLLSLGDVVEYEYNDIAFDRPNSSTLQHRTYTGLIYQNVKDVLPSMAYEDQDGYGCLNYLSYDYINLIAGALQQTITKQKQLEKRISILEEENINLKQQLSN